MRIPATGHLNLTFHGAGPKLRPLAADEAAVWVDASTLVTVLDAATQRGDTTITVDDGNASDVSVILPALLERRLRAIFFVVAGRLGQQGFLDRNDLHALTGAGMEIGCHGMRHRAWRGLGADELEEELVRARAIIEEALEAPVRAAACPFGAYDRRVLGALRRTGYARVYTSDGVLAARHEWLQPRTTVRHDDVGDLVARISDCARATEGGPLSRVQALGVSGPVQGAVPSCGVSRTILLGFAGAPDLPTRSARGRLPGAWPTRATASSY